MIKDAYMDYIEDNKLFLFIVLGFFVCSVLLSSYVAFEWDEGSFLMNSQYFFGNGELVEESRPVALSIMVSILWFFTGESVFGARVLVALFGVLCLFLFHRISAQEFERPLDVTIALALMPLMLYWSSHFYTDVPGLFFLLGSLYMYKNDRNGLAGVLMSISITFRFLYAIFAVGMGLAYIKKIYELPRYSVGGIIGALPFFIYNKIMHGNPLAQFFMYTGRVSKWSNSYLFATTFDGLKAVSLMVSAGIPAYFKGWRKTPFVEKAMVGSYTAFMLLYSGNAFFRYWLPVLPFVLLAGYRGLDRKLFAGVVAIMIVTSGLGIYEKNKDDKLCYEPLGEGINYLDSKKEAIVTDNWAIAGYKLDQNVYSPWKSFKDLKSDNNVKYALVADGSYNYSVEKSFSNSCRTYYVYNLDRPS